MKSAKVILVPNPGRDTQSAKDYRLIYLLFVLGKVVESVVENRLTHWFKLGRILYREEYGFRGQKSAKADLWRFASSTFSAFKQRRQLWEASLDLR